MPHATRGTACDARVDEGGAVRGRGPWAQALGPLFDSEEFSRQEYPDARRVFLSGSAEDGLVTEHFSGV